MPPKRDAKGKGKTKEKPVEVEPFNPCDVLKPMALVAGRKHDDELDESIKEGFELQMDNCREKLLLLQRKSDELTVKSQFYPDLFDQLDLDKKDLSSYLERCLDGKEEELKALKTKYETSETLKQEEENDQRKQLEDARIQIEEMKLQLSNENAAIRVQLAALKSVDEEKEELTERVSGLTREFYENQEDNKEKIYQQERTNTINVERLRRDANVRIVTVAEECTIAAQKKLHETVKQCTIDSVRATNTIAKKYSDASISRLLERNDALRRQTDENQRLIEILTTNRTMLDQKNQRQREVMEDLIRKSKAHERLDLDFRFQQTNCQMRSQLELTKDIIADERKRLTDVGEKRRTLQKNLDEVSAAAESTAVTNKDLYDTLTTVTPDLRQILPTSDAALLRRLEMLASEDAVRRMEPSEHPPPQRQKVRLMKPKTRRRNCVAKQK